ncbi:hypothetical protein, partial [Brenneria corticis]
YKTRTPRKMWGSSAIWGRVCGLFLWRAYLPVIKKAAAIASCFHLTTPAHTMRRYREVKADVGEIIVLDKPAINNRDSWLLLLGQKQINI